MDDSEVVTSGPQSADKEAVEDTLQESELESARMENIIQSKMTEQLAGATRREMRQLVDEYRKVAVLFCNLFRLFL
jgi:hypothetical protein